MDPSTHGVLDEAALERLYTELEGPMVNVVYRWVWSVEDAQDIVQEAFVRLWKMRRRVRMDTVKPLAYRIAVNLASKHRRSRRIWKWVPLDRLLGRTSPERNPDQVLTRLEREKEVRRAVEALPESLRQVVMLCELTDLTYDEVAEMLSIPSGTVGSRRHRALRLLRSQLESNRGENDAD